MLDKKNIGTMFNSLIPGRQAKSSVFSCIIQRRASVSPKNQVNSSAATSSILWLPTMDLQPMQDKIVQ
jgi:hypothetical protein